MFQEFNIVRISTSLTEKKVFIEFSLDVKEETVTLDTLVLAERATSRIVDAKINVRRNVVELELVDWPVPNAEYLLKVQRGITSIVDDELPDSLQRSLIFKSEITSVVEVLSPAEHEEIEELNISWKEKQINPSENLVNSYYLEISTDNAFYDVIRKSEVHQKEEVTLSGLSSGQYYLRIRAQKDGQYGRWSDIITFIVKSKSKDSEVTDPIFGDEDDEPIFEDELIVIGAPMNGESPESFLIEFDEDIDVDSIQDIVVIRRSI